MAQNRRVNTDIHTRIGYIQNQQVTIQLDIIYYVETTVGTPYGAWHGDTVCHGVGNQSGAAQRRNKPPGEGGSSRVAAKCNVQAVQATANVAYKRR